MDKVRERSCIEKVVQKILMELTRWLVIALIALTQHHNINEHTYKYFLHVIARHETEHSTATDIAMVKAVSGYGCSKEKNNHLSYLGR